MRKNWQYAQPPVNIQHETKNDMTQISIAIAWSATAIGAGITGNSLTAIEIIGIGIFVCITLLGHGRSSKNET